jgi:two-component system, OmpR family, response regulator
MKCHLFATGESFLKQIEQHPDIVILDYYLNAEDASAENGMKILKKIKRINPDIKVVMLSGMDEVKMAVNSLQLGAVDYVSKSKRAFMKIKYLVMNLAGNSAQVKYEKFKKRYSIE